MFRFLSILVCEYCLSVALLVGVVRAETFISTDVPVHIPDAPDGPARSHLTIPVNREILDLNITFTITHTWDGDLGLYLESPDCTTVRLAYRCGGSQNSGDNFTNTTLDDEASAFLCNANPPYTGTFLPEHALYTFDGLGTIGQWEFRVTDFAAGDTGSIQAWRLDIVLGDTLRARDPFILPPSSLILSAHPNPFNPNTTITFSLPQAGDVKLAVYDVTGREVTVLSEQPYPVGEHSITFDGSALPSGLYFVHFEAGTIQKTHKVALIK
jgi:subtilisin-like proprotein convertase family protein